MTQTSSQNSLNSLIMMSYKNIEAYSCLRRKKITPMPQHINSFVSPLSFWREVAQPGRALELANALSLRRRCRSLPMVGFILACLGHRNRAVAGSNPALPTKYLAKTAPVLSFFPLFRRYQRCSDTAFFWDFTSTFTPLANRIGFAAFCESIYESEYIRCKKYQKYRLSNVCSLAHIIKHGY